MDRHTSLGRDMTIAQRSASRRGVAAVVASLALAAGLGGTLAAPSSADDGDSGEFQGVSELHLTVKGHLPGGGTMSVKAGLLNLQVEGSEDVDLAYCVDFIGGIEEGDVLPAAPWDDSSIANREAVERILNSYFPTGVGPADHEITGTDSEKAAATQAAIWHFTNGFVLEGSTGHPAVLAHYDAILPALSADATRAALRTTPPRVPPGAALSWGTSGARRTSTPSPASSSGRSPSTRRRRRS